MKNIHLRRHSTTTYAAHLPAVAIQRELVEGVVPAQVGLPRVRQHSVALDTLVQRLDQRRAANLVKLDHLRTLR